MRNLLVVGSIAAIAACGTGPRDAVEPPTLKVEAPARGSIQAGAGKITVSGTVASNADGDAIEQVLVNNVAATVTGDTFTAQIAVPEGATLIQTVVRDRNGTTVTDTRAVLAGELRPVGTQIPRAVTAALSADAFTKLSAAAGEILAGLDLTALLAPLQPIAHFDDENGEDCLFARVFVDQASFTDVKLALSPVAGGLAVRAEVSGLAVDSRVRYKVACLGGENTVAIAADKIVVAGTLQVAPNGSAGFTTKLTNPQVSITNSSFDISGFPDEIRRLLRLDSIVGSIVSTAAELAMNPLVNQALGALAGPQQLEVLGTQLTVQVAPDSLAFAADGAEVGLAMTVLLAGGDTSPGFIYTDNGMPTLRADSGLQLGIADDLANELLAEAAASGLLDLSVATPGGAFDTAQIQMTVPPMISAGGADGRLRVVLGDMLTTFVSRGTPVAKAAISATVDLAVAPAADGHSVALQLGAPDIHLDIVDDLPNTTGLDARSLAAAATGGLAAQIDALSKLFGVIPLPAVAGLQVRDLSVGADSGYVMVRGEFD